MLPGARRVAGDMHTRKVSGLPVPTVGGAGRLVPEPAHEPSVVDEGRGDAVLEGQAVTHKFGGMVVRVGASSWQIHGVVSAGVEFGARASFGDSGWPVFS